LIRQITINCAERGLLLLRVRDEARMTVSAFEALYESTIAYGIRKALMAEQRRIDLEAKIHQLKATKKELQAQVDSLNHSIEAAINNANDRRAIEAKAHADEVERIQKTNEQLKVSLESMLSAPKK
jgi:dynein light intermediate chain